MSTEQKPQPFAWAVIRDSEVDKPELFLTEAEARKNACLGVVDAHVMPLYQKAEPASPAPEPVAPHITTAELTHGEPGVQQEVCRVCGRAYADLRHPQGHEYLPERRRGRAAQGRFEMLVGTRLLSSCGSFFLCQQAWQASQERPEFSTPRICGKRAMSSRPLLPCRLPENHEGTCVFNDKPESSTGEKR